MNYITVQRNIEIRQLAQIITGQMTRCVFVLEDKKLIGVISVGDLLRFFIKNKIVAHQNIEELIEFNFKFVQKPFSKQEVLNIFKKETISALPVLGKNGHLLEVLTPYDYL
jgi:predicted transcriptional regulator